MLRRGIFAAALLLPGARPQEDPRAAWLATHAIRLRTLDAADGDFSDLEPLKHHIAGARIVLLGEQTHGDGSTFLGKARLIAFLHERMGFDVLCFESGLYDCRKAWEEVLAGKEAWPAMQRGIFPIWMESRQLEPLTEYVGRAARSPRPLELCGYDCQLTGKASSDSLLADTRALVGAADPPAVTDGEWERIASFAKALLDGKAPEGEDLATGKAALDALAAALEGPTLASALSPRERAFWRQVLESLGGLARHLAVSERKDLSLADLFNPRDEQGARNMLYLARARYPDRKIVVWAASMHLLRAHPSIDTLGADLDYRGVRSMGDRLSEALGEEVFTIAFTAGPGEAGLPWGDRWTVPPPPEGSLEDLCAKAGLENAIVPVRGAEEDSFLRKPLVARPLGNRPMRADWSRVLDAFVFTKAAEPSRRRFTREEVEEHRDPVAALEKGAALFRRRWEEGNAWADKGDLDSAWETWREIFSPSPDAVREAEAKVRAWATRAGEHPALGWRVHLLFALLARERGDLDGAIAEVDRAFAAYPEKDRPDPMVQGSWQHLANRRAMLLWDRSGFPGALAWAADALAREPRFQFFHAAPWLERLGEDRERREELRRSIAEAYEKRAAAFP
ncbi:MAG TPA: erythromycin esterase family protein, partial [Planctomycetota bacterium]|nr:erythromycin esterase family protein [Planctomycetota bacterium]